MRSKYIIFLIILIFCSSIFLTGCNRKEISYEMISFENAPKEVQNVISELDQRIRERESTLDDSSNDTIVTNYHINYGKDMYSFTITNNEIPKIEEVGPDETFYGIGVMIKFSTEHRENVEFPDTVAIVKLKDYNGRISYAKARHQ